jgi:dipeptidyl aminopeptidase/acylaminoacyl peptidase
LHWTEALDEGNPRNKVPHRDKIVTLSAPFTSPPVELLRTVHRFRDIDWVESGNLYLARDYDRDRRFERVYLGNAATPASQPRIISDLDINDRYNDPGAPVQRTLATNHRAILRHGEHVYLTGTGASAEGDRPFLDRFNLTTGKSERLFRAGTQNFETFVALLSDDASRIMTRRENPTEPPNFYVRELKNKVSFSSGANQIQADLWSMKPFTNFPDPAPQLRGIKRQLVKYKRPDGVDLQFTLMLPPDYKAGTRLPTVVWAYPLEFNDPATAGQVSGSTLRYNTIAGASHLFFLLNGYAVLDNATMPIIGSPEKANDTFVEQIVASAKAAIDKATEMGVTDPARVGVGGHSYGAFMTANLLAHSDLFRAGIARSGAYNRTLTPFGFQGERRTYWEATDVYERLSPFTFAHKIKEPILLIHGEADDNSGTFPVQSERMYQAVRGNGGTVRYVVLPAEAHGYAARESTEHTIYEMLAWFDKYVKTGAPQSKPDAAAVNVPAAGTPRR